MGQCFSLAPQASGLERGEFNVSFLALDKPAGGWASRSRRSLTANT